MVADNLVEHDLTIIKEIHLDIEFSLYTQSTTSLEDITRVYSIGPAISQTQKFIHERQLDYAYAQSTVDALKYINATTAAIAPQRKW